MELTHRFSVPGSVEDTWHRFEDIADVAQCFPGAQVTSVEGDTFEGTVKVKLGPIALVYAGSGSFTAKDPQAHTFEVVAKGRDKRGNGTAGATVTVRMSPAAGGPDAGTDVQVDTDLAITGKPAQFGRGVMQDVSDKLLAQFVACLQERSQAPGSGAGVGAGSDGGTEAASGAASAEAAPDANAASTAAAGGVTQGTAPPSSSVTQGSSASGTQTTRPASAQAGSSDALDLGAAVLPVLLRSYGRQLALGVLALLGVGLIIRRLRRG